MFKKSSLLVLFRILMLVALSSCASAPAARAEIGPVKEPVEIFVTSWCPYCARLEQFLNTQKVEFVRYDIERDLNGFAKHQQLGGGGVPVIRVGTQVFRGFDEAELSDYLMERRKQ